MLPDFQMKYTRPRRPRREVSWETSLSEYLLHQSGSMARRAIEQVLADAPLPAWELPQAVALYKLMKLDPELREIIEAYLRSSLEQERLPHRKPRRPRPRLLASK